MNTIGIALVWCAIQVTLMGVLASVLYAVIRRFRPAAGPPVVLAGLLMVVMLSLLALSPWPRWSIPEGDNPLVADHAMSMVPEKSGQFPAAQKLGQSPGASSEGDSPIFPAEKSGQSPAFWQLLLEELSRPQAESSTGGWRWQATAGGILLAAMACGLGWLVLGVAAVRRQRLRSRPVFDGELSELIDVLRAELGCRRPIEVRRCGDLVTAATVGWRRPALLLPSDWKTWTIEQRRAILAHEIAHVRSRDFQALLFGQLGLVLHYYHPLVHWLMSRLRLEQELAADAAAASVCGGQRKYLTTIAEIALNCPNRPLLWPARAFLPTQTTFLRRIAMLRNSKLRFDRLSPAARLLTIGTVLLCGLFIAGLRSPAGQSQALAEDAAVAPTDKPVVYSFAMKESADAIDVSFMSPTANMFAIFRPTEVVHRPELASLIKMFEESGLVLPSPKPSEP